MGDWIKFKEVLSYDPEDLNDLGVHVIEFPPFPIPEERKEFKQILGLSGSLAQYESNNEGDRVFNSLVLPVSCFVSDLSKINQIATWLRGHGFLVLGNRPNECYMAHVTNQIDLRQLLRNHSTCVFSAIFRCDPYRYRYPFELPITVIDGGILLEPTITNPGNVSSAPIYTIEGTGAVELTIGSKTISISNLDESITIDMGLRVAYKTGSDPLIPRTNVISKTGWPFTIPPGESTISFTGNISSAIIDPRWRDV